MIDIPAKTYQRPPITESVIELRMNSKVTMTEQKKVVQRLKMKYPHVQEQKEVNVNIDQIPTGGYVTISGQPQGFRLTSNDQTEIVLLSPTSVVSARLAPYLGWEVFSGEARLVWKIWKRYIKGRSVARIGVRYVNRIDIPSNGRDKIRIEDYLTFYPKAPEISASPMQSYLIQVTVSTYNHLWTASITSTKVPPPLLEHISFLLDIDVFRTQEIPIKDDELWTVINEARDIKNSIFQRCITPESERLFE
ncbi:MAG: TIGR04255 family protein [Methylococcales bacterium]